MPVLLFSRVQNHNTILANRLARTNTSGMVPVIEHRSGKWVAFEKRHSENSCPDGEIPMESKFLSRLFGIVNRSGTLSGQPSIVPSSEISKRTIAQSEPPPVGRKPELVPGNFFSFEFFIELKIGDVVHLGYLKVCLRDTSTGTVRWGSKVDWSWPDPNKLRIAWVDDEQRGLSGRTLASVEDALGAEGTIGDMRLRFEKILDLGRNQIVYALYCPERDIRLAYGFDRCAFELTYES